VKRLYWEEDDEEGDGEGYWVMDFEDGSELSFRMMAELDNS